MADEHFTWEHEWSISSKLAAARRVQEEVLQRLQRMDWSPRDIYAVRLAMEEALVNAVVHGNQRDPEKRVIIRCGVGATLTRIEIVDEGAGFNPDELPDPTGPDRLECPCGRGVMLMRHFMSRVEFNEKGNRVVMERRRGADQGE